MQGTKNYKLNIIIAICKLLEGFHTQKFQNFDSYEINIKLFIGTSFPEKEIFYSLPIMLLHLLMYSIKQNVYICPNISTNF